MRPEDRAVLVVVISVLLVAAGGAAYFLVIAGSVPAFLPVPDGTIFTANATEHWAVHFTVLAAGAVLVGAWTAHNGFGTIFLMVVNGTVSKPWPPPVKFCQLLYSWAESNGSSDMRVDPGPHTAYWSTGDCSSAAWIEVTQAIRLVPL